MQSTDKKARAADIEQLSKIQFPGYTQRCSWRRAKLCAAAAFVLLSSTSLVSRAEVVYKIVDSRGTVTYSDHPPTIPGNFTVTKINKLTGAVISYKPKGTKPNPPAPAPEQPPAPLPEQPPAPLPEQPPTPPAPTPSPDPVSCSGVVIAAGSTAAQIQAKIDANVADSTFCFAPGIYVLQALVRLKDGVKMICTVRRACVLTGLDQYRGGFNSPAGTARQEIRGFIAERFLHVQGQWPVSPFKVRDFGVIEDNEIRGNQVGIDIGSRETIRNNFIHHNRRYGISGGPGDDMLIEGNEVSFNNTSHFDPNDDAGGSKVIGGHQTGVNRLTWRRNYVHDNFGNGIWSDGNLRNVLYEENLVENNTGSGIFHEISWDAVIKNNTLRKNNTAAGGRAQSCWHGGAIDLNNSHNGEDLRHRGERVKGQ